MPYFKPFYDTSGSCISYMVCCPETGTMAVIDPSKEYRQYVALAESEGARITHVIDTHIHADHVSGARDLVRSLGGEAELYMAAGSDVDFEFMPLEEGGTVDIGGATLAPIRTPGHTVESISLLYTDRKRGDEPWVVFTGDSLFVGDVGRLDLFGHGSHEQAYASLQRLLKLPDYVEVCPAHYAGSDCASNRNLSFKTNSTIGFERRFNKMLAWDSFEQFERLMRADPPAIPPMWREIKLRNQGRGEHAVKAPA